MYHDPGLYTGPMSTFADSAAKSSVRQRLERLTPNAPRQWGRMTPHQMVCHLTDGYRMSAGQRNPKPVHNIFTRVRCTRRLRGPRESRLCPRPIKSKAAPSRSNGIATTPSYCG